MPLLRTIWILFIVATAGIAEPTPQPSVEPPSPTPPAVVAASSTASSDLKEESQDQVAILKQINRVNDDGSYTFGYEAADGSFKIETRDVAGNVKGMFGFVDDGGELKRISYTASNGTGYQTTGSPNIPPLIAQESESTTRISLLPVQETENPHAPIYIYKVTTRAPQPEVIQHIPKLRPTPGSLSTTPTESAEITDTSQRRPVYGTVLPIKSPTPNYITLTSATETPEEQSPATRRPTFVQTVRPRGYKKVLVSRRPAEFTTIAPSSTTPFYTTDLSQEMMETGDDIEGQVESNSLADTGLITSGTEDSPDVFGVNPTARPYPADAYQTLFSSVPQYQRILQGQGQLLSGSTTPQPIPGAGDTKAQLPRIPSPDNSARQDQTSQPQSLIPGRRLPSPDALPQDLRLPDLRDLQGSRPASLDPRLIGIQNARFGQNPGLTGGQDPRLPIGEQDPRLYGDTRLDGLNRNQDPRYAGFDGIQDARLSGFGSGQDARVNGGNDDPRFVGLNQRLPLPGSPQDPRLYGQSPRLPQDPSLYGLNGGRDDPRLNGQIPQLPGGGQDPRLFGLNGGRDDPRLNGRIPQQDPRLYGLSNGRENPRLYDRDDPRLFAQRPQLPVGPQDPRLSDPGRFDDQRIRDDIRFLGQGLPIPGTQGQTLPVPRDGTTSPRTYQGLVFPSGPGRQRILPPPGAPGPLDYSQNANARSIPNGNVGDGLYPQRRPVSRRPPAYNPDIEPLEQAERQPPPPIPPPQAAYNNYQRTENRGAQSYIMEQLLRMFLAAQTRQQPPLSPFQQALIATLGQNNIPPELLRNPNYDPSYQRYGPYQRDPYYPQPYRPGPPNAPYDYNPRYPYYPDPYRQPPYPVPPYPGYNPYPGVSPDPYSQFNPEEALLRMFLGTRFPQSLPQNDPQIQHAPSPYDQPGNSPSPYDQPGPSYPPRQPLLNEYEPNVPDSVFWQRVPVEGGIVQRSPPPPTRDFTSRLNPRAESSQRSTTVAPKEDSSPRSRPSFVQRVPPSQRSRNKGSRNVQIIDEAAASESSTTAKP